MLLIRENLYLSSSVLLELQILWTGKIFFFIFSTGIAYPLNRFHVVSFSQESFQFIDGICPLLFLRVENINYRSTIWDWWSVKHHGIESIVSALSFKFNFCCLNTTVFNEVADNKRKCFWKGMVPIGIFFTPRGCFFILYFCGG